MGTLSISGIAKSVGRRGGVELDNDELRSLCWAAWVYAPGVLTQKRESRTPVFFRVHLFHSKEYWGIVLDFGLN